MIEAHDRVEISLFHVFRHALGDFAGSHRLFVRRGGEIKDPRFLLILLEPDPNDRWDDEATSLKVKDTKQAKALSRHSGLTRDVLERAHELLDELRGESPGLFGRR